MSRDAVPVFNPLPLLLMPEGCPDLPTSASVHRPFIGPPL